MGARSFVARQGRYFDRIREFVGALYGLPDTRAQIPTERYPAGIKIR